MPYLSSALIFAGFQSAASRGLTKNALIDSEVVLISADQLVSHTKGDSGSVYWLGPVTGDVYSDNDNQAGVDLVSYWPKGSNPTTATLPTMTIATYDNSAVYATYVHPLSDAKTTKTVVVSGRTVRFSTDSMNHEIVTFSGKPEIVEINYPTWQTAQTLTKNAENLHLVSNATIL